MFYPANNVISSQTTIGMIATLAQFPFVFFLDGRLRVSFGHSAEV